jgi:hypothetical protein
MYKLQKYLSLTLVYPFTNAQLFEVPLINDFAHQRYNISISVGTPPQTFNLLFDTGASDILLPKSNSSGCTPSCPSGFEPSTSSSVVDLHIPYDARYGLTPDLAVIGKYYNDTVSIGALPSLPDAEFAVGNLPALLTSQGNWGIFGFGSRFSEVVYSGLTSPYRGNESYTYTPLWERYALASPSRTRKFSVWLNQQSASRGSVLFGAEDSSKYTGALQNVPINLRNGKLSGWNVNVTGVIRVSENGAKARMTQGNYSTDYTLDTGSPNMYVPTALYEAVVKGLNATDIINGAPYVECGLRETLGEYLEFGFGIEDDDKSGRSGKHQAKIRVPYSEIIYPFGTPVTVPPVRNKDGVEMCYFGMVPGDGPVRLLGASFLRSAYLVFDAEDLVVKMAQAKWT